MPFETAHFDHNTELRLAQEEAEDRYMTETNEIMAQIPFVEVASEDASWIDGGKIRFQAGEPETIGGLLYVARDPLDLPPLPLDGYPGPGLKEQVRDLTETHSAWDVIKETFFPMHGITPETIGHLEKLAAEDTAAPIMYGKKDSAMLGESGYERNERDFYPTPANVTEALCQMLKDKGLIEDSAVVWEPACGDGQMVAVLKEHFAGVIATDICPLPGSGGFEANFLNSTPKATFHAIITNPPFGEMIDQFMKRALIHLRNRDSKCDLVAFVARHELDCGVKRNKYFRDCPEFAAKITLTWRPRWIADSTGSPRHNYAVYVWMRKELHQSFEPRVYYANNPDKKR